MPLQGFFRLMNMPIYEGQDDFVDPDLVPRTVMAVGASIVTGAGGMELDAHKHRKAQLLFVARGM